MSTKTKLIGAVLIVLSVCPAVMAGEPSAHPMILGAFLGEVINGDNVVPVVTIFQQTAEGRPCGTYTMSEGETMESGTLSGFEWEGPYTLQCQWQDKYGSGTLRILFSSQYNSFRGFWGTSKEAVLLPWDGVRQD